MNFASDGEILRWKPATWLQVVGPDAAVFLQGQFTNDLRELGDSPRYGLLLNVKGKVIADGLVFRGSRPDEFWIGSYASEPVVIHDRLASHVIADDVTINDQSPLWAALTVFGKGAVERVSTARKHTEPGFVFVGRRAASEHCEWVMPAGLLEEARLRLGNLAEIDSAEAERRRIQAGIPLVPADIGPGDLPNEGGLEADAISYTKGCYLGQEVMARLKTMGQVRRRLLRVRGTIAPPRTPAPLFLGARQVGELRSVAPDKQGGCIGLAMVSLLHVKPGESLACESEGNPVFQRNDAP